MEETLNYVCPKCDGPVYFNSAKQKLVCEYCDSEFEKDIFSSNKDEDESLNESINEPVDWKEAGKIKEHEMMEDLPGYSCSSCGAQIISDGNTIATECMYCTNATIIETNIDGMLKPDYIIPFKVQKEEAKKILTDFYSKQKLIPNAFVENNRIEKVAGMYVPYWLFSCKGDGEAVYDGSITTSVTRGKYKTITTKYYELERAGHADFKSVPVDASKKLDDAYMDGLEPYNFEEFKEFNPMYMAGYFADKFDLDVEDGIKKAESRVINSMHSLFRTTLSGYSKISCKKAKIETKDDDVRYALLPIWMFHLSYNDTIFPFAINGQTGKISGKLPVDKTKSIKEYIKTLLISFVFLSPVVYGLILLIIMLYENYELNS